MVAEQNSSQIQMEDVLVYSFLSEKRVITIILRLRTLEQCIGKDNSVAISYTLKLLAASHFATNTYSNKYNDYIQLLEQDRL